jgi:hypothetical protein
MLEQSEKSEDTMLVFKDLYGDIWQIIKRPDFTNFDELIETDDAESEETSEEIIGSHLIGIPEKPKKPEAYLQNIVGLDLIEEDKIDDDLKSFKEESNSYYDSEAEGVDENLEEEEEE